MSHTTDYPQMGQPTGLLIHRLLERPLAWAPNQKIVYRDLREMTYVEFGQRVHRLASLLASLGLQPGERVGVLDWDSHRYLECFFAIPMFGAVLHTVNVRLAPEQVLYTILHAEDRILLVHPDFLPLVAQLRPQLKSVKTIVVLQDGPSAAAPPAIDGMAGDYEELLARASPTYPFTEFDENTVATLFYTTGTTGDPKGVFFTHRQIVLHTLGAGLAFTSGAGPVGLQHQDVYMPLTPMFHVHAWGVPYIATLLGLKQVYPGRYEPALLVHMLSRHGVTFSHCVPTILLMLLNFPGAAGMSWAGRKVIIGGAPLPKGLARLARQRGINIMAGYGMSETCPIVSIAQYKPELESTDDEQQLDILTRAGFPVPLVSFRILDGELRPLPPGPENQGELVVRAPWLTPGYFREDQRSRELWRSGWMHTGDMAYRDADGYIRITDRLKDVIKIGGEWISSLELENALSQHPLVKEVAVVGILDPKWDERPHADVVLKAEGHGQVTSKDLFHFLHEFIDRGAIHKRAILTEIRLVESLPRTSVGKINKREIRSSLLPRPSSAP
jgi:fatty-acyl-CoA synthase